MKIKRSILLDLKRHKSHVTDHNFFTHHLLSRSKSDKNLAVVICLEDEILRGMLFAHL